MTQRSFRTPESYAAERVTRDMLAVFLESKGLTEVVDSRAKHGVSQSQTIDAILPGGERVSLRVRLCWRRNRGKSEGYSAAQLMAKIKNGDWEGSIAEKLDRERSRGITHLLLVQREEWGIDSAALIPVDVVLPIWCRQRDISNRLIRQGRMGRRKKNHAKNGSSPTLYIRDDRAVEVAQALWDYPGVSDISAFEDSGPSHDEDRLGGGFGDPVSNREVELAAVGLVRQQYQSSGWRVRSVEHERCGFDLVCEREDESRHVEVKGVSGPAERFIMTARELERAEDDPLFSVCIVTGALSNDPSISEYSGSSLLKRFEIHPIQYRAARR